jgi:hypothetical protein
MGAQGVSGRVWAMVGMGAEVNWCVRARSAFVLLDDQESDKDGRSNVSAHKTTWNVLSSGLD